MFCLKIRGSRHTYVKFIWCQFWCTSWAFLQCKTKLLLRIKYVTNFDAPDVPFDYSSLFSDAQVEKFGNQWEKMWNWKSRRMKTKLSAIKLSQIRRRIELCLREIILRFEMNLENLLFSWQFNSYSNYVSLVMLRTKCLETRHTCKSRKNPKQNAV
jgi:hypothetical protein